MEINVLHDKQPREEGADRSSVKEQSHSKTQRGRRGFQMCVEDYIYQHSTFDTTLAKHYAESRPFVNFIE